MPDSPQLSSLGKSDSLCSESSGLFYKDEALEKDLNEMSKEINLMLSTYAKILSSEEVRGDYEPSSERTHRGAAAESTLYRATGEHSGGDARDGLCSSPRASS